MVPLTDTDRTVLKIALRELLRDSRQASRLTEASYQSGLLLLSQLTSGVEFFIDPLTKTEKGY